jgi:hypothetical protein
VISTYSNSARNDVSISPVTVITYTRRLTRSSPRSRPERVGRPHPAHHPRTIVRCPHGALGTVMARIEEFGLELLDVRLVASRLDR